MPVEFTAREDLPPTAPEGSAFAPVPVYDRSRSNKARRKMPSAAAAPVPAFDDPMAFDEPMVTEPAMRPIEARPARRSTPVAALIAAPVALALIGGAWLLAQQREAAAPMQTAASTSTAPAALETAQAPPVNPPMELPQSTPAPEAATPAAPAAPAVNAAAATVSPAGKTPPPRRAIRQARARPAPAPTAEDSAAEASATVPAEPRASTTGQAVNPPPIIAPPVVAPTAPTTPSVAPEVSGQSPEVTPYSSSTTP